MGQDPKRLSYQDILTDNHVAIIPRYFAELPAKERARFRWVFNEPASVRLKEVVRPATSIGSRASKKTNSQRSQGMPPLANTTYAISHRDFGMDNARSINPSKPVMNAFAQSMPLPPDDTDYMRHWRRHALLTSQGVTNSYHALPTQPHAEYVSMLRKSHTTLLRPGADKLVLAWLPHATKHQRDALSMLLWQLGDHMNRSRLSTYSQYFGPKSLSKEVPFYTDALRSSFKTKEMRPRSAPVKMLEDLGPPKMMECTKSFDGQQKPVVGTWVSQVPLTWSGSSKFEVSTQSALNQTISMADRINVIRASGKSFAACPPATGSVGSLVGHKSWHGVASIVEPLPIPSIREGGITQVSISKASPLVA